MSRIVAPGNAPGWVGELVRQINHAFDTVPVFPKTFTVDTAPSASKFKNHIIVVTDGDTGSRCLAISDGTAWKRVVLGATISVT